MEKQNFDRQWLFMLANDSNSWWAEPAKTMIDLPHDFSISMKRTPDTLSGASNGFFPGGYATYEKAWVVPANWQDKEIILEFEGVYMNATVRINNQIVAQHPYGYTSFHCNLTPYILYGRKNIVRVDVNNNALPNSRWYSGSGIYRHVWLMVGDKVHVLPWGVCVTTPEVTQDISKVVVNTEIGNNRSAATDVRLRSTLIRSDGSEITAAETSLSVPAGSRAMVSQTLITAGAGLWSVTDPCLHTLRSEVIQDDDVIDSQNIKIGIRSVSFDSTSGFRLNGIPMKLKGGCVHHDCGLLGSAAYDRAEERKVELLKSSGFNAVRCAHNPPSPAFLDACDRIGLLVIDEAFDCWRESKNPNDYAMYFQDWWQRDMASMVLRDRNHPSIIMWSTGNEIGERDGHSEGYAYARKLADFVRSLDPSRAVTNALCNIGQDPIVAELSANTTDISDPDERWGRLTGKFIEPLDIAGYNYLRERYEGDGQKYPERIICGTETFAKEAFDYWSAVEQLPYVIGDFVWTSLDYLGESGIGHAWYNGEKSFLGRYPWHQANCGDIDICGFKRPQSYYRDCIWGLAKSPYVAVHKPENFGKIADISAWGWPEVVSSWSWPGHEGKPLEVDVYSICDEIELFINSRSVGRKPAGKANRYLATFEIIYEAGEINAVGYLNGAESSRTVLRTGGLPAAIRLTPDRRILKAEFGDLCFVTVEIVDDGGNIVHNATNNIYFSVCGAGSLFAVGSGNPMTEEMYVGNQRKVHEGRAMAVVRTSGTTGEIILTAVADGIPAEQVILRTE